MVCTARVTLVCISAAAGLNLSAPRTVRGCGMELGWWQSQCGSARARAPWRWPRPRTLRSACRSAAPEFGVEIVKFETTGDSDQTSKLLVHGGKGGAFVAEIRAAVTSGKLHAAMHSLKDMPGNEDTPGLVIGATLTRDPPTDALVLRPGVTIEDIKRSRGKGLHDRHQCGAARCLCAAAISRDRGDSFSRRGRYTRAQARQQGNAAVAGWRRGRTGRRVDHGAFGPRTGRTWRSYGLRAFAVEMLPAVGQGIVAVECAVDDWQTRRYLALIDDPAAHLCCDAEREVLWVLNGHCNSPIAGYSTISGYAR